VFLELLAKQRHQEEETIFERLIPLPMQCRLRSELRREGGPTCENDGRRSPTNKKRGGNFAPSPQRKLRSQTFAAKAALWNVEYSASNFFTVGMPSMNLATIFSICGYTSRL
jgi:hypothetical protein